ncbi:hypothetical protein FNF27_05487 [Cafeteria roenbergensis]|uniref:Uncharacterized protein n=2 Tax=Cafeteria roenbergensis TaxID=33653 RepID=A0A5A8E5J1_CAFRO|nr:hypothetical protein FNF29_08119 [Cafeteria roenbergensis]KAA0172996.1 hypothetical protein FNF27_05487 [Cafeteria roenbergensis]|eukprot:KAA0146304.1 hypothetical protein FNF29_08119 [Cafeteria roenbergensis]
MASRGGSALSEDDVKRISGQYDLESVRRLNLRDMGLADVSVLAGCTGMVALDLRGNKLRSLAPLRGMTSLRALDVSDNGLSGATLAPQLEPLVSLTHLNVQGSAISRVDDAVALLRARPTLRLLALKDTDGERACPACAHPSYLAAMVEAGRDLIMLDGESMFLRDEVATLLGERAGHGAESEVSLPAAYSRPWFAGVPSRRFGPEAPLSGSAAVRSVRTSADALREAREAIQSMIAEDRKGGRAVDAVLRAAGSS